MRMYVAKIVTFVEIKADDEETAGEVAEMFRAEIGEIEVNALGVVEISPEIYELIDETSDPEANP